MSQDKLKNAPSAFTSDLGMAHNEEHILWNRRQFLMTGGLAGLGTMLLGGLPVSPLMAGGLSAAMTPGDENILVMIKMFGGNDGLNMIVPYSTSAGKDEYLKLRPTIGLKYGTDYNDKHLLGGFGETQFALPSTMAGLMPLWNEGKMAVLHNVGYPDQNYSHFTSIELWSTAADDTHDKRINSGIMGRYLDQDFPSFSETPPTVPPALRIGYSTDRIFTSPGNQQMELVFNDPNEFYRLAAFGKLYETEGFGECPQGEERAFLRQLTNNSLRYSQTVTTAYNKTSNKVAYPKNTTSRLAEQLAIIARLIKGRLGTRIFLVNIDGFDTHTVQKDYHMRLLGDVANSVKAFYDDLKVDSAQSNVTTMTYSEFGRTIRENGSMGTDHGNLSPLMMFGDGVKGGFKGSPIDLNDKVLKNGDTVVYYETQKATDYRHMFSTVLKDWLCLDGELVDYTMGQPYPNMDLFNAPCGASKGSNFNTILLGHNPNETDVRLTDIKFSIQIPSEVKVYVKSLNGKTLAKLFDNFAPKGSYTIPFDPLKWKIPPGEYVYQLNAAGKSFLRRFVIV
ncbi:MAG: DUF1501 domain-containing protein [Saprospiraceae bacterium]|nr:DUF1501 domain-containing protein [Candidatus Vicinibacter affinis]